MTSISEYIRGIRNHLLRQDRAKRSNSSPMDSSDDEAPTPPTITTSNSQDWHTLADVPHLELMRRRLLIKPPSQDTDDKNISAPVLELKCSQSNLHIIREALLQSRLPTRQYGIFIPPSFFNEERKAVYTTAVRHMQYLTRLKVIPVSGIHRSLLDLKIPRQEGSTQTFLHYLHNLHDTTSEITPAPLIFNSIEASHLTDKTGKWYFLTTDENYQSAVNFIDNQLIDIYRQAGFHRLEQTQHMPFSRGPHRLTKLSEAASSHASQLKNQVITGPIPTKVPAPSRSTLRFTYDPQSFPSLKTRSQLKSSEPPRKVSFSSVITTPKTTESIPTNIQNQFDDLNTKINAQNARLDELQVQLTEQQNSIQQLRKAAEDLQQATEKINDVVGLIGKLCEKFSRQL